MLLFAVDAWNLGRTGLWVYVGGIILGIYWVHPYLLLFKSEHVEKIKLLINSFNIARKLKKTVDVVHLYSRSAVEQVTEADENRK
jgi:hypothetical protein